MNQLRTKWIALALALAMLLALAGCALTEVPGVAAPTDDAAGTTAAEPENTDAERAVVVAEVGAYTITKGELIDEYEAMLSYYSNYGYAPTADADVETLQDTALQGLVAEKLMLLQAEQQGILPLDADTAALVEETYGTELENMLSTYRSYAQEEGYTDVEAGAVELVEQALLENDWNMDFEGYKTWLHEQLVYEKAVELLEAKVTQDITASKEDIVAYYDDLVAAQTEQYAETPLDYLSAAETYDMEGGDPVLVVPEGYLRVKVIGIQPESAIDVSYDEKCNQMDDLEAEYGRLALKDAGKNQARMNEIKAEYALLATETDTLYAAHTMAARAKAQEAMAKINGGASFDEVLAEYGDDEAYTLYETIAAKGRLMLPGNEDGWDVELHDAALALQDGAHSDVIEVAGVFYILQRVSEEEAGTIDLEQVRDILEPLASESAASALWTQTQQEWLADTSIVTYYEETYRDVGKAVG